MSSMWFSRSWWRSLGWRKRRGYSERFLIEQKKPLRALAALSATSGGLRLSLAFFRYACYRANDGGTNRTDKTNRNMKTTRIFALMAVLILAGCREGRDKELPQKPASVDTSEFDESYYERMRVFERFCPDVELDKWRGTGFFGICALTSLNASHFVLSGLRRIPPPLRGIPLIPLAPFPKGEEGDGADLIKDYEWNQGFWIIHLSQSGKGKGDDRRYWGYRSGGVQCPWAES